MKKPPIEHDYNYIKECISYCPDSGVLRWNARPESHFSTASAAKAWNTMRAGKIVESKVKVRGLSELGYVRFLMTVRGRRFVMRGHRIAWILYYGKPPEFVIDHIDGDSYNNKIENLRDVTQSINRRNSRMSCRNTSGFSGVSWVKKNNKWRAYIFDGDGRRYIGAFDTIVDAVAARIRLQKTMMYTDRHGRERGIQ